MAKTTEYAVTTETGTEVFGNLGKVAKFLGVKKITKADLEANKYPMVSIMDASESPVDIDLAHKAEFAKLEAEEEAKAHLAKFDVEDSSDTGMEVPDDSTGFEPTPALDQHTLDVLAKVEDAINATPEDNVELFDAVCELEDSIREGIALTDKQASLLTLILTNALDVTTPDGNPASTNTEDTDTEDDSTPNETEYPEVGDFKDEKAMKKFIKTLSDKSLEEWCILEGAQWKPNDHESINRMRMAMAIKAIHFPDTAPKKSKKSKSKYASYATEDLVQMALDADVEVPDDKGDARILRMYTIMALRKAGIIE